jgi:tetratricopeptide (TPR) repeat protein
VTCRTCGKEISDPFDQALGVCDDCRAKSVAEPEPVVPRTTTAERPVTPTAAPTFPSAGAAQGSGDVSQVRTFTRRGAQGGKGKVVGLIAAVLALVAVAGWLLTVRPWDRKKGPTLVTRGDPSKRPVEAIIQQWKLKYPDIDDADARALTDEGEALLVKDTTAAYREAEQTFEQALVLDPSSERALAGWVLSLAFGRPGQIDDASAKAAESMLTAAEKGGGDARVFVAHAHLLIARNGNPNDIRVLAERGLSSKSPADRALAALAVGQTLLSKNPELANKSFKEALQLDPKLKRAYLFAAQLAISQGRYKDANDSLEKRLELDADQWEAAEALAKLAVDVGEAGRARRVLEAAREAAPRSGRPRLALGMLAYQHLNDFAGAVEQLTGLVNDPEATRADRSDALVHLAAIQRIQGDVAKAGDSIDQALELAPDSVPAKLQRLLVLLERGVASSARLELDGLKGKLGDKQLEALLEGRMQIAEGRFAEAMGTLAAVSEAEPRRVEATLLAGAAAARARRDGKAWEFCLRKALKADPYSRAVPPLTQLYVRPADLLKPAVNAYSAMVADLNEDPNPTLCEGAVAWFMEDPVTADKHFTRVLSIDPKNGEAYAYRAFIALRKRDITGGLRLAGKAIDSSRNSALGYLAQAQAQMLLNKADLAKVSAATALKHGPALLAPRVLMADVEAARQQPEEARRLLTSVLLADPLYRDAKRVLFKHAL